MSKQSKTARASMPVTLTGKVVISDEDYIKDLRNNIASAIHVTQESAKALLRAYDAAQQLNVSLVSEIARLENDVRSLQALVGNEV